MANIKLKKPQIGAESWGDSINENFAKLEKFLNSTSAEMSSLQQKVYATRQLVLGGAIDINDTKFELIDGNFKKLVLNVYPFKPSGTFEDTPVPTDIITVPTNVCYKVIDKFDKEEGLDPLNPKSINWAMGDFFVVGELVQTTKSFSRLPIAIGMYMRPTLGVGPLEGSLVWNPVLAETDPEPTATALPLQYAYGTVMGYPIKNQSYITVGKTDPISASSPTTGTNGFSSFPILHFYQYTSSSEQLQRIEMYYKLDRTVNNGITYWQVNFNFDDDDDSNLDNIYMFVTMLSNGDLITSVEILEALPDNETV